MIDAIVDDDEAETQRQQFEATKVETIEKPQIVPRRYDDVANDDDAANDEADGDEAREQQHFEQHGRRFARLQSAPEHEPVRHKPDPQQHVKRDVERHHRQLGARLQRNAVEKARRLELKVVDYVQTEQRKIDANVDGHEHETKL